MPNTPSRLRKTIIVNDGAPTGGKSFKLESTLVSNVSAVSTSSALTAPPAKPSKKVEYKLQKEGLLAWVADMTAKDPSKSSWSYAKLLLPADVCKDFTYNKTLAEWKKEESERRLEKGGLSAKKRTAKKKSAMVELLGKSSSVLFTRR